jgi:hypothetical protein
MSIEDITSGLRLAGYLDEFLKVTAVGPPLEGEDLQQLRDAVSTETQDALGLPFVGAVFIRVEQPSYISEFFEGKYPHAPPNDNNLALQFGPKRYDLRFST